MPLPGVCAAARVGGLAALIIFKFAPGPALANRRTSGWAPSLRSTSERTRAGDHNSLTSSARESSRATAMRCAVTMLGA